MNELEIRRKIAYLEFANDQIASEIEEIDEMMKVLGFTYGLETVKETAWNLYENLFDTDRSDA